MKTITVVYEIIDEKEWSKQNPLKYEHNGLRAVIVRIGNAVHELHDLEEKVGVQ